MNRMLQFPLNAVRKEMGIGFGCILVRFKKQNP